MADAPKPSTSFGPEPVSPPARRRRVQAPKAPFVSAKSLSVIYEYRLWPARFPQPGAVVTPVTPRRADYARQKLPGEPTGEFWIAPRATESWAQGSTGAARQPSVRP